ncbi:sensor histidine kinase [Notoacmeibacter ruber]|uniref:Histidine kinase n=1 Tax=Notoacmeibacter ruber TaxID=2670375 RepID=A0A3L7JEG7_9HYPH|nr:histidine kinase dimerization/phosphoacceptor domain -containing protein [Notoacmeibacter ruber]RLQ88709.1 histidine kinase [Notoacmeibacter ruber]
MKAEAHPRNEERLARLREYEILDTADEQDFDDIVDLASRLTGRPVSLVSLVDEDRQWFKARKGDGPRQTDLDNSVCAHGILQDGLFEIEDLSIDERTADMPMVDGTTGRFRFYAGVPLKTSEGLPLGMLCVLDTEPGKLSEDQRFALRVLGDQVLAQLNLRAQLAAERETSRRVHLREAELQKSLAEQELLAKEIDHRVKNSLAMVSSFLNMQRRQAKSEETKAELETASRRVAAVSLLHQELYDASVTGRISLPHLSDRIMLLLRENAPNNVELRSELDPIILDSRRAAAFAVVANEFITNSFKYAFKDKDSGTVFLSGKASESGYRLILSDDGVGNGSPAAAGKGLGTRIIEAMSLQLGGDSELSVTPAGYRLSLTIEPPVQGEG